MPKPTGLDETEESDPRAELVRRIQEYERFQQAAGELDLLPRIDREVFTADADWQPLEQEPMKPEISLQDILNAFQIVLERAKLYTHHHVSAEVLSIRERMGQVLNQVDTLTFVEFTQFFRVYEGKMGVVVTLIAILELIRQSMIELVQAEPFAPIYVKAKG